MQVVVALVAGVALWRSRRHPDLRLVELVLAGHRIRGAGSDTLQLGGDFVVAPDGTIAYSRPQRRDDRPPVGELLSVIEDLAGD